MTRKKLLLLAYAFPPHTGGGVQRPLKFSKYLPQFGWKSIVVSSREIPYQKEDPSLLSETSKVDVYRVQPFYVARPTKNFFLKGINLLFKAIRAFYVSNFEWVISAYIEACRVVEKERPQCILATGNPFGSFFIGARLRKKYGVPLILDYRDSWSFSEYEWANGFLTRACARFWEKRILSHADHVIVVKPKMINELKILCSNIEEKVSLITNGFDDEDFQNLSNKDIGFDQSHFNIVFTGIMWQQAGHQSPLSFLKALQRVIRESDKRIRFHIFGDVDAHYREMIKEFDLDDTIIFHGYVSHEEAVKAQVKADLLLLLVENEEGPKASEKYSGIIPGKLFEYLGSGTPMLTIAPQESFESELTVKCGAGLSAQANNPEDVYDKLKAIASSDLNLDRDEALIKEYSRVQLTECLVKVLSKFGA